jgi:putative flippase GtrA
VRMAPDLLRQTVKFSAVGVLNTIVGLGTILALMALFGLPALLANLIGYSLGVCTSYVLNRSWTFRASHSDWSTRARFVLVMGSGYLVQFGFLALLLSIDVDPYFAQMIATGVYATIGFVGSRFLVFASQSHTNDAAVKDNK